MTQSPASNDTRAVRRMAAPQTSVLGTGRVPVAGPCSALGSLGMTLALGLALRSWVHSVPSPPYEPCFQDGSIHSEDRTRARPVPKVAHAVRTTRWFTSVWVAQPASAASVDRTAGVQSLSMRTL